MWKTIWATSIGTSHESRGQPCQDFGLARSVQTNSESVLVAACSDGAGSAKHSEVGSRLACETIVDLISDEIRNGLKTVDIDRERILGWHEAIVNALTSEAKDRKVEQRDLACTLLTAIVSSDCAVFSQVGDGVIVISMDDSCEYVFWPQSGEYINTTNFLTDLRLRDELEFKFHDGIVQEIAMLSDGLQRLALNYAERRAHKPFFVPLFRTFREAKQGNGLADALALFLNSARVNEHTDDDKTLILATRWMPDAAAETL